MNKEKLLELKSAMEKEVEINKQIDSKRLEFAVENKELFNSQAKIRETIVDCKCILMENAEAGYIKDGIKKRLGGVGIRIMSVVEYDSKLAFAWALEHKLALRLDDAAFKRIAKTNNIDFVETNEKVTVTFPKEIQLEV